MNTEKIHYKSAKAAQYKKGLSGWVSNDGRFFGENEHLARYAGCTHKDCEKCGAEVARNSYCRPCQQKYRRKVFDELRRDKWDGKFPVYSFDGDESDYFFDIESILDRCEEMDITPEDMRLCFCYEAKLSQVNDDYWADEMPEDFELPDSINNALSALNKAIRETKSGFYFGKDVAIDMSTFPSIRD